MFDQSEIERRLLVWHALSDLFLDTELQPHDYRWIADTARSSGYGLEVLRLILIEEVGPAFISNLFSVAGEWSGWSKEEVRKIMLHSLRPGLIAALVRWTGRRLSRQHTEGEWLKIFALLEA